MDQVTAIIEGKKVVGKTNEILEVQNTISVYERIDNWNPTRINSILKAHKILMNQLIDSPGLWRTDNVGIIKGKKISHVAPSASRVPRLMKDLFEYLKKEKETDLLIKVCIFHRA
ncbi:MAG: Fic family protein [Deltaproteobacteria bacterium]|nr:Fic family protein [Deltaproteobacteria bacterium]